MTLQERVKDLLFKAVSACREDWVANRTGSVDIQELKDSLLSGVLRRHGITDNIDWSNYRQKITQETVKKALQEIEENYEADLKRLVASGFIEKGDSKVASMIPFDQLVNFFSERRLTLDEASQRIRKVFSGDPQELLEFLSYAGILRISGNEVFPTPPETEDSHLDEVLTFIEQKDALQIRYGIYETIVSGSDVLGSLRLPDDPLFVKLEYALRRLMDQRFLLPLSTPNDIRKWLFRSRVAETVRLLSKLRQRFWWHRTYRDSPSLTRGVKLEIVDRKLPKRHVQLLKSISNVSSQLKPSSHWVVYSPYWEFVAGIVTQSLEEQGFEHLSDFQDRCFKKIFAHLANFQSSIEGLVIVAGTGTGKTLSYLAPLLLYLTLVKAKLQIKGTKAICIYPRIKLAENQIESFIKTLYAINSRLPSGENKITIAIDYSGTPYSKSSFATPPLQGTRTLHEHGVDRYWEYDEQLNAYECPYSSCPQCNQGLYVICGSNFSSNVPLQCLNPNCGAKVDFVLYCKDDIAENPPDILIITTESLNLRLTSAKFQRIFGMEGYCNPKLVMVDEIHLHTSLKGSQIAYLIRRLLQRIALGAQHTQQNLGEPIVLGLSATIGRPDEFFSELSGIPKHIIDLEGPREEELEKSGVEYFIFVKPETQEKITVLSNLIQTCMCILHNMPQHEEFPEVNYKALGFVDSLDLVRRWHHDLDDAEANSLYQMRDSEVINRSPDLISYFGPRQLCACTADGPDPNCVHFREGECWWFMRYGNSQANPLTVRYKTAGDGSVPERYDLVVTTSAMEVGYDDPDMMCVVQYQSPMNISSFTQRKGRGGRKIRVRPISVAVLSPYRTKDVYYYRNHHILIEPSFEKPLLNVENKSVRKIHGFYALMDRLAFERRNGQEDFPTRVMKNDSFDLERILRNQKPYVDYLRKLFGYLVESQEISEIFSLVKRLVKNLETSNFVTRVELTRILDQDLPENLFSSINLPTVDIYEYNPFDSQTQQTWKKSWISQGCAQQPNRAKGFLELLDNSENGMPCSKKFSCSNLHSCWPSLLENNVDVNLALIEASIANASFRWKRTAYWIPPYDVGSDQPFLKQMEIENNWLNRLGSQSMTSSIDGRLVPLTLRDIVPRIRDNIQRHLPVIRPEVIREVIFLEPTSETSHWIYCEDCDMVYAGYSHFEKAHLGNTHSFDTITQKSTSYPFSFYRVSFTENRDTLRKEAYYKRAEIGSPFEVGRFFGIYGDLFSEIYFANWDAGEYLKVIKAVIGSTCSIVTRRARYERIYGFVHGDEEVALGYPMETDGCNFWLNKSAFTPSQVKQDLPEVYNTLKNNFFRLAVLNANKKPGGKNGFSVNAFLSVYLVFVSQPGVNLDLLRTYLNNGCQDMSIKREFRRTVEKFFGYNTRTVKEVLRLFDDQQFMQLAIENHEAILNEGNTQLINNYIEDTLHHSIKHALKSAFVILGGFESERDVGGWTYLNYDSDVGQKHIYIFEHGMHGTGGFRSIFQKFRQEPHKMWNLIDEYLVSCPTADEEHFLIQILQLDKNELQEISGLIDAIFHSSRYMDREEALHKLQSYFRNKFRLELRDEDVRSLGRVFTRPLELEQTTITNWELYRELNIDLYCYLKRRLGRDPTTEEVQETCFARLTGKLNEPGLPVWQIFFDVLSRQVVSEYTLFTRKIQIVLIREKELKQYLDSVTLDELQRLHNLPEDQQISEIADRLGYETGDRISMRKARKIAELLFEEVGESPLFAYYHVMNAGAKIDNSMIQRLTDSLSKRRLREEIEKRLLNTCVDSCPSCLQTPCDIDFELRSRLVLSRRVLKYVVVGIKQRHSVNADTFSSFDQLVQEVRRRLENEFYVYVQYSLDRSAEVAQMISKLLASPIIKNGTRYYVTVNSSGYREISLRDQRVVYEIALRCKEAFL